MIERVSLRDVLALLGRAPKPPEEPAPTGATKDDLEVLRGRLGFDIPQDLLQKELGTRGWPFDQDFVTAVDPRILDVKDTALLHWSAYRIARR